MRTDVNVFLGRYPHRRVGTDDVTALMSELAHASVTEAWVSSLPAIFWQDPAASNDALLAACDGVPVAHAVAAVHPGMPGWVAELDRVVARGAIAVRCDPAHYGISPVGNEMTSLVAACAQRAITLVLAV